MENEKDYPEGGFNAHEMWQTLQSLRDFAYGEFGDANERVWITRQEARQRSATVSRRGAMVRANQKEPRSMARAAKTASERCRAMAFCTDFCSIIDALPSEVKGKIKAGCRSGGCSAR